MAGNLRQRGPFSLDVYDLDKNIFLSLITKIFYTPPPPDVCTDWIVNGDFEESGGWLFQAWHTVPPVYSNLHAHSPDWSMQTGIPVGEENKMAFTEIFQDINIPSGASSATLSFWIYTISNDPHAAASALEPVDPGIVNVPEAPDHDQQYAYILDTDGDVEKVLFKTYTSDRKTWVKYTYDLDEYIGESIRLLFGTYNDGRGGRTGTTVMYTDDVSLKVCR
jgi:hypothetical protein